MRMGPDGQPLPMGGGGGGGEFPQGARGIEGGDLQEFPQPQPSSAVTVEGVLDIAERGNAWLRNPAKNFIPHPSDIEVPRQLADRLHIRGGSLVKGQALPRGPRLQLVRVDEVEGVSPEQATNRIVFSELTVIDPTERLQLENAPKEMVTRVLDLIAPVGLGQRGLINSPPKAGKTIMLQRIANAVTANRPDIVLYVLLVDERPEEVTDMRRSIKGTVFSSSNDRPTDEHLKVAEMTMERAKRLVEDGKDVVVLLDSITRLARAYNREVESSGRTLSGGVDSRAMERPKRLFGAARNTEEAGSLTIIGTALIDTGSRMDEVIFEEFKGTGNMEVTLDRGLMEKRIFPSINIPQSGTRKEEKLFSSREYEKIRKLRQALFALKPVEAMERLLDMLGRFKTNDEFLDAV
jgi:transcription termination factor Rho